MFFYGPSIDLQGFKQFRGNSFPGHARVVPGLSEASFLTSEDFEVLWALAAIAAWHLIAAFLGV